MRKDIQALRAVAVLAVLLYHFWPHRLPGGYVGVDVFFVISGFLITFHLLKKPPINWRGLVDFWARRVKRLIPAATVVLLATVIASLVWLPETMIHTTLEEAAVAAIYGENWMLASTATDYLASTDAPSPIQHYWSLSVEEQFYIFWPMIIGGIFLLSRRFLTAHKLLAMGMGAIFTASLAYSIYLTSADPAAAYFVTPTRVWELAIGGLVALFATKFVVPVKFAVPMVWAGLAMIGATLLIFTESTPFPGYTALLPTVGTALVILAATDGMKWSPRRLFGLKPVQFIGDISYSIYLWHWPVVVIAPFAFGVSKLSWVISLSLIVNVFVLAYLTKTYIEDPVRQSRKLAGTNFRAYAYAVASILVVVGATFASGWHPKVQAAQKNEELKIALENDPCVGAGVLRDEKCKGKYEGEMLSSASYAKQDKSVLYKDRCFAGRPMFKKDLICQYGNTDSETRIALFGNSHAGMWHPAIEDVASRQSWALDTYLASICYTMNKPIEIPGDKATQSCQDWNKWALDDIIRKKYDTVVMSNRSFNKLVGVDEYSMHQEQIEGYKTTINKLLKSGTRVFVIRDSPEGKDDKDVPDCLSKNHKDIGACMSVKKDALVNDPLYEAAASYKNSEVYALDISDKFCDESNCYPVIGGVVVYFDHGHLTESYVKTLTPDIEKPLVEFVKGG